MAGPPKQQRYNAKARQSVAGGSSHKKRRHSAGPSSQQQPDSNRDIIDPNSVEDQEWREKEAKRRELLAASQEDPEQKLNSKKRKRLDAYIASRLKKEARADLLEELAQTSAQVRENRQDLVSTRTLGTGKGKSARELLQSVSKPADPYIDEDDDDDEEDFEGQEVLRPPPTHQQQQQHDERPTGEVLDDPERRQRILDAAALFAPPSNKPSSAAPGSALASGALGLGSALARGPDGQPLMPVMRTRKRKGPSQRERKRLREQAEKEAAEENSDFDSSASSSNGDDEDEDDDAASEEDEPAAPAVTAPDDKPGASDEESDSEGEAILMEAMRRRGLPAESEEDDDSSDGGHPGSDEETDSEGEAVLREAMRLRGLPDESEDDDDEDSDAGDDSERDTDSEGEVVLLEAMRRRGLALPSEDEGDSGSSEDEEEEDASQQGDESREASFELGLAGEAPISTAMDEDANSEAESLPWEGFGSEDDAEGASEANGEEEEEDGSDEEEEEGEDDGDETAVADEPSRRRGIERTDRSSGFKDWARSALGFGGEGEKARDEEGRPLEPVAGLSVKVSDLGPNDGVARGPLGEDEAPPSALSPLAAKYYEEVSSTKAVRNVPVHRTQDIIEARLRLPVVQEEERVVKTILENEVTVICGETGSGKTTQVAQMLFERGFGTPGSDNPGLVGITQPRRVAAVSTARRVAEELNLTHDRVSHQVRFDATVSPETSLKFMTDGVLLRELAADLLLSRYSVVIVDEAHERSVNTDVLIGVLSRIVRLRAKRWIQGIDSTTRPLRLVIMSATLRVADFVENATLFPKPPPLLKIEARQHPVTVHFNRKTPHDYIEEAVKKAGKIHMRLPPGGILIFMTGEQEIRTVCQRLEAKFGRNRKGGQKRGGGVEEASKARPGQEGLEAEDATLGAQDEDKEDLPAGDADAEALDTDDEAPADGDEADLEDEAHKAAAAEEARAASAAPMHILPLYSMLSSERQLQVFQPPPEDSRLVVVATNVAETSLTIPNIRYVVDCGRAKERKYDATTSSGGISSFRVDWISKASAAQRAGRAGRTGPGHCYRLYSSNVYEEYLDEFAEAEIRRTPVEGLVLQMKAMNIDNVVHFPFPTPPDREAIARAERVLVRLGALKLEVEQKTRKEVARITELGRTMSLFPLSPRYAKLLVQGQQHGCLPYVVALVAALTVGELFVRDEGAQQEGDDAGEGEQEEDEDEDTVKLGKSAGAKAAENAAKEERKETRRRRFAALERFDSLGGQGISDAFRALAVVGAHGFAGKDGSAAFCEENFIRPKAMDELTSLRSQLSSLVLSTLDSSRETEILSRSLNANSSLPPPSDTQLKVLRQLIACAYIDQVAVRADVAAEAARNVPALAYEATEGRLSSRIRRARTCRWVPYLAAGVAGEATYIHPSSAIYEHDPPEWCVFSEVTRSMPKKRKSSKKDGEDGAVVDEEEAEEEQPGRVYLRGLTKINPAWIAKLGKDLCSFSKPEAIGNVATSATSLSEHDVVVTPTYGTGPACDPGNKSVGWELTPIKAKRRWVGGAQGWKVDL